MVIIKAKYKNEKQSGVNLTFKDGTTSSIPDLKHRYKHTDLYNEWIDGGGVPESYKTDEELEAEQLVTVKEAAMKLLRDTDFYMTIDKYNTLTEARQIELSTMRANARLVVNS